MHTLITRLGWWPPLGEAQVSGVIQVSAEVFILAAYVSSVILTEKVRPGVEECVIFVCLSRSAS